MAPSPARRSTTRTLRPSLLAGLSALAIASVAPAATPDAPPLVPASTPRLALSDVRWLDRVTYGIDGQTLSDFARLGKRRFLERQLASESAPLPPAISAQIAALEITKVDGATLLVEAREARQRLSALPADADKKEAQRLVNERGNRLAYEAARRHLLRAIYSPEQLREQLVWFWTNHFSVFSQKANVRWMVGDYEERAIRPRVLGHFRELVLATMTHPAMLQYLDNAQNAKGHINENYARELMELHTLGVDAGYTQADVQELARILTGVGIDKDGVPPALPPRLQPLYRRQAGFEFNPSRHDMGDKTLLGHKVSGRGFAEVEEAVDILTHLPACARHIAHELAVFFVADEPPPALVAALARTFTRSDGDLTEVMRSLLTSRELAAAAGRKLKDPMHFVVSAIRLAYEGRPLANAHPVVNALASLGEPLYGRPTPDGYPSTSSDWASSGQMIRRFEVARTLGGGNGGLFEPEDGSPSTTTGFPRLASRLYYDLLEPSLSAGTRAALDRAATQQEWNTYLLASPEFNHH